MKIPAAGVTGGGEGGELRCERFRFRLGCRRYRRAKHGRQPARTFEAFLGMGNERVLLEGGEVLRRRWRNALAHRFEDARLADTGEIGRPGRLPPLRHVEV